MHFNACLKALFRTAYLFLLSGFGFEDDASWFQWDKESKFSTSDHTFQVDLIPKLKEQGMDVKLGIGL